MMVPPQSPGQRTTASSRVYCLCCLDPLVYVSSGNIPSGFWKVYRETTAPTTLQSVFAFKSYSSFPALPRIWDFPSLSARTSAGLGLPDGLTHSSWKGLRPQSPALLKLWLLYLSTYYQDGAEEHQESIRVDHWETQHFFFPLSNNFSSEIITLIRMVTPLLAWWSLGTKNPKCPGNSYNLYFNGSLSVFPWK